MRLSHGFVRGEALSCIYHGWSYGQAGECLRIPAHPGLTPPETIRVAVHAVEEAWGVIWVAVGETTAEPPRFEGFVPLRSLTAHADLAALKAATGATAGTAGLVWPAPGAPETRLLSVPQEGCQTLIHVLVPGDSSPSQRIAASRAAETLRRTAEDIQAKGLAPWRTTR